MYTAVNGCSLTGIDGRVIKVETDISNGIPQFEIVGLPGTSVKEAKGRVRSAIKNCGWNFPTKRITINLAPSNLPKGGSQLDLAIAISILAASDTRFASLSENGTVYLGELSLEGNVCSVDGVLPMAMEILEAGFDEIVLPWENYEEVKILAHKVKITPIESIGQLVTEDSKISTKSSIYNTSTEKFVRSTQQKYNNADSDDEDSDQIDFSDIVGQKHAKRALEIAVAGMHNILLIGPPGTGKTMLAKSIPSIMPEMTFEESLEVSKIYSAAGCLYNYAENGLITTTPVRMPHHTITETALIGGGKNPRPGEISLAHRGILILDEMSEFTKKTLDMLRQPLENGRVIITRSQTSCEFPANFMLVATTNPCPCGYYTVPEKLCTCNPWQLKRYIGKISGALWDRLDLQIEVPQIDYKELTDRGHNNLDESQNVQKRVLNARKMQQERYNDTITSNSMVTPNSLYQKSNIDKEAIKMLKKIYTKLGISLRGHDKILKIARTIADLDMRKKIRVADVAEAANYRGLDRRYL